MRKENDLLLLSINLASFEGEGGGGEGTGTSGESGVASTKAAKQQVLYGIQDDMGTEGQPIQSKESSNTPDPSAKFEELIKGEYKDAFDKRVQSILDRRFKDHKSLEGQVNEYSPVIQLLMEKYEAKDMNELRAKFDSEVMEELAYKKNMDVDTYREFRESKELADKYKEHVTSIDEQQQIDQRVASWYEQADQLKADYPDFDFRSYVQDQPEFVKLLNAGVPVKQAYELMNLDNIKQNAAKQAQDNTIRSIQANGARPKEAAVQANNGAVIKSSVSSFDKNDRAEIARRVQRGETIKLG